MLKEDIVKVLKTNITKVVLKERNFKHKFPDIYKSICETDIPENISFAEKVYMILNDIKCIPVCEGCGKETKWLKFSKGYQRFCSNACSNKSNDVKELKKEAYISAFGVPHPALSEKVKKKRKETNLKKYGVEFPQSLDEVKNKVKDTCIERYGVIASSQNIDVKEKAKITCIERYGAKSPILNEHVKNKMVKSVKESLSSISVRNRRKANWLNKSYSLKKEKLALRNIKLCTSFEDYKRIDQPYMLCECEKCGHEFMTEKSKKVRACENCSISNFQYEVQEFVKSLGLNVIQNDRDQIAPSEIDIYIESEKIGIECHGLYFHRESEKINKNYHLDKFKRCLDRGISLIQIYENEWTNRKEIVKSIVKSRLNLLEARIFARKCHIKEIDAKLARPFLEKNHLQGFQRARTHLALYHENEIVSVCSFGTSRFKKNEVELIRFASKLNTSVIGGFSKLIKFYMSNYSPEELISYCDLRYFNSRGYQKAGWELIGKSGPNYFYFKLREKKLMSRMQFQKHKLKDKLEFFDENLTEWENMKANGYDRIWDCGNLKLRYIETDAHKKA